ncbi:MAG: ATP-binding cassette domain-containing protein [bacterium]|nr:ATP-binding cassette domain-containing protein [bacterium]
MISVEHLVKRFGARTAVDGVTFEVSAGEVLGFLGPNGAGKSTTMRMLTCFIPPTEGTAKVHGYDILEEPVRVRQHIGYLPENAPVYHDMSVAGYLRFIAEMRGLRGSRLHSRVEEIIETCYLKGVRNQSVGTLSKGYKQRVCFAQAILHDPPILILDEPTDGLDPNQKYEVRQLIKRMGERKCIILSTHILEEVEAVCTRAIIIAKGKIVANGTPAELRARSTVHGAVTLAVRGVSEKEVVPLLGNLPNVYHVKVLGESNGCLQVQVLPKPGMAIAYSVSAAARERKWAVEEFHVEQGRLDEVFRMITQE